MCHRSRPRLYNDSKEHCLGPTPTLSHNKPLLFPRGWRVIAVCQESCDVSPSLNSSYPFVPYVGRHLLLPCERARRKLCGDSSFLRSTESSSNLFTVSFIILSKPSTHFQGTKSIFDTPIAMLELHIRGAKIHYETFSSRPLLLLILGADG